MAKNQRSRKLIRNDLQLKVVFITLFVASLVLLINFQLSLASLWSLSNQVGAATSVDEIFEEVRRSIINKFLISVAMAIPLAASVGILYSFKFSGPVHRFKMFFTALKDGRWDRPCTLRKGDDLMDVCEAINGSMDQICALVKENADVVREVRDLQVQGSLSANSEAQARFQKLTERLESVISDNEARIPSLLGVDSVAPAEAGDVGDAPAAPAEASEGSTERSPQQEEVPAGS